MVGSPGLVVMEVDSHPIGPVFESQHRILDGHFFTLSCLFEMAEKMTKQAGNRPFFYKTLKSALKIQVDL